MERKKTSVSGYATSQEYPPLREGRVLPIGANRSQTYFLRKRWWVGLALVFFLFFIIFIIPVGHIPGLRQLARMMGFRTQDTQSMSFARTLLTWVGADFRLSLSDEGKEFSVFDKQTAATFNTSGPQSGLFDLAAVNASRRARGLRAEGLHSVPVTSNDPDKAENRAALNYRVKGWNANLLQADEKKHKPDVYFGEDTSWLARNTEFYNSLGAGSSDTVKELPKANIIGADKTDWLEQAAERNTPRAMQNINKAWKTTGYFGINRSKDSDSLKNADKPQRDLAQVWLLSDASTKTKSLPQKQRLASAGYMSAALPAQTYNSGTNGSDISIRGNEKVGNSRDTSGHLNDGQCRNMGHQANSSINGKMTGAQNDIRQIRKSVPKACGEGINKWQANLRSLKATCKEINDIFANMHTACGVSVKQMGRCETTYLDSYAEDLSTACEGLADLKAQNPPNKAAIAAAEQEIKNIAEHFDTEQLNNSFNVSVDQVVGSNDFFPVPGQNSAWLGN